MIEIQLNCDAGNGCTIEVNENIIGLVQRRLLVPKTTITPQQYVRIAHAIDELDIEGALSIEERTKAERKEVRALLIDDLRHSALNQHNKTELLQALSDSEK